MLCSRPFKPGNMEFGCGQCMPCRLNKRREWTGRLLLEASSHSENMFITLTYDDANLPDDVSVRHMQLFFKRLRKRLTPILIRHYYVGEYGDRTARPHYHAAIFGASCPETYLNAQKLHRHKFYSPVAQSLIKSWPFGNIHVGTVTPASMAYNCSHITKKWKNEHPALKGRKPEFARMSLQPAIGVPAIKAISAFLTTNEGSKYLVNNGDIATVIRNAGLKYPIGRTLTRKIRESIGMESRTPDPKLDLFVAKQYLERLDMTPDQLQALRCSDERKANQTFKQSENRKTI